MPDGRGGWLTTLYLGPDLELAPDGTWHKYPHPEVRLSGTGVMRKVLVLQNHNLNLVLVGWNLFCG